MLKRLLLGLFLGLLVGAAAAYALVAGLGLKVLVGTDGALIAYAASLATGVLVGLVAGKPIWAQGGRIEAGLKAFFGGLLAVGLMFAARRWLMLELDLTQLGAGAGSASDLPAVALPAIGGALGAFFELDNTGAPDAKANKRIAAPSEASRVRVGRDVGRGAPEHDADADEIAPERRRRN
jgi:hypothetical protein